MLRAVRARRIAAATAFGGGGLTLLGAGTVALLYLQARLAHRAVGFTEWKRPRVRRIYGEGEGPPISFALFGDSTAAGFALTEGPLTPGVLLAEGIAAVADRPVRLRNMSVVGAASADLGAQLDRLRGAPVDLAVVFIGANDVIRLTRPADSADHLRDAVRRLRAGGAEVVVATCPDLGSVRPIGWPLRTVARRASRRLAAAQTVAVVEAGGRTVSLTDLLSDEFWARPEELFGPDRFHPSARGYAAAASVVLPSACVLLGLLPELEEAEEAPEEVLPVHRAAAAAVDRPGTEVSGTEVAGRERGPLGRWAMLLRRRPEAPAAQRAAEAGAGTPTPGGGTGDGTG
ncbi:SGNH/GDSL hydrolase family protein [Nocardiopsis sp. CNT-189]|uniref:SGNH/GDSL hydrolase family protein n=1 Tax=Nocardiopsis oceanisediminis TaxID=2816862 RepID=UPI003B32C996